MQSSHQHPIRQHMFTHNELCVITMFNSPQCRCYAANVHSLHRVIENVNSVRWLHRRPRRPAPLIPWYLLRRENSTTFCVWFVTPKGKLGTTTAKTMRWRLVLEVMAFAIIAHRHLNGKFCLKKRTRSDQIATNSRMCLINGRFRRSNDAQARWSHSDSNCDRVFYLFRLLLLLLLFCF